MFGRNRKSNVFAPKEQKVSSKEFQMLLKELGKKYKLYPQNKDVYDHGLKSWAFIIHESGFRIYYNHDEADVYVDIIQAGFDSGHSVSTGKALGWAEQHFKNILLNYKIALTEVENILYKVKHFGDRL